MKPRVLAAFCGVGGDTFGYQAAGFEVDGVDRQPLERYCGDEFYWGDAIEFIRRYGHRYHLIHAGPPCQHDCTLSQGTNRGKFSYPNLLVPTRDALESTGRPYVIEQPPGRASRRMRKDLTLCGEMFGLRVTRHRNFELGGWTAAEPQHKPHRGLTLGYRHGKKVTEAEGGYYFAVYGEGGGKGTVAQWQEAMGIHWTSVRKEIAEAIPPAYAEYIGRQFISHLKKEAS